MSDFIGVDVKGLPELLRALQRMPDEVQDAVIPDMAEYLKNRMQIYAPYQHITRASAYPNAHAGPGWFSDRQRRYVMAKIRSGEITPGTPQRTRQLANSWRVLGKDRNALLANEAPYAKFVQGNSEYEQARQPQMVGWRGVDKVIPQEDQNLLRRAIRATNRALRKLGLTVRGE
jgi:hypothetical protein